MLMISRTFIFFPQISKKIKEAVETDLYITLILKLTVKDFNQLNDVFKNGWKDVEFDQKTGVYIK